MERIKQALERARRERGEGAAAAPGASAAAGADARQPAPTRPTGTPSSLDDTGSHRYTQTRVAEIDPAHLARHHIVAARDRDPAADAYRMLRTRLLQVMAARHWHSLAVTSPGPGEGKSVTALNLAISLSREVNHTVLLVDLDLRNPSVHRLLGLDVETGISDYLFSELPLSKVLVNPSMERLVVLPGREGQDDASELMSSPRMRQLIDDITHRYPERLVIFDLPPVCTTDDVIAVSPLVDAFLLVVRDGGTTQPQLRQAAELLKHVSVVGTVLNMADEPTKSAY